MLAAFGHSHPVCRSERRRDSLDSNRWRGFLTLYSSAGPSGRVSSCIFLNRTKSRTSCLASSERPRYSVTRARSSGPAVSLSPKNSPIFRSKTWSSLKSVSSPTLYSPCSMRERSDWATPIRSESSIWVRRWPLRSSRMREPTRLTLRAESGVGMWGKCCCAIKARYYNRPFATNVKRQETPVCQAFPAQGDGRPGPALPLRRVGSRPRLGRAPPHPLDGPLQRGFLRHPPRARRRRIRGLSRVPDGRAPPLDGRAGGDFPLRLGPPGQRDDGEKGGVSDRDARALGRPRRGGQPARRVSRVRRVPPLHRSSLDLGPARRSGARRPDPPDLRNRLPGRDGHRLRAGRRARGRDPPDRRLFRDADRLSRLHGAGPLPPDPRRQSGRAPRRLVSRRVHASRAPAGRFRSLPHGVRGLGGARRRPPFPSRPAAFRGPRLGTPARTAGEEGEIPRGASGLSGSESGALRRFRE